MNSKISALILILSMILTTGFSQENTSKKAKEEKKLEKQKQIEAMVNAKEFVFVARTALPSGMRSVNLTTNTNYVKFQPDLIDSYMPYFGKAYSGIGYGGDTGLKFKDKPEVFDIVKKKKAYQIDVTVKTANDVFRLSLSVGFEGSTSMSVISNNRSTISYQGEISAPEKPVEK